MTSKKLSTIGESGLITRIAEMLERFDDKELFKGVGDDCAVLKDRCNGKYRLLTTDMLVEGDHFDRGWQDPWQIGWKSVIANLSDIAAMGGLPRWGLISIAFPEDTTIPFTEELFEGMVSASDEYGLKLVGGDTTHGDSLIINIALIGEVEEENLCMRGDAEIGDLICVSGDLGKSWAGLELFRAGKEGYTDYYLQPDCRLDLGRELAPRVNAIIDVSDGLASEVIHISEESGVGAEIEKDKIPISEKTRETGEVLDKDPLKWALSGGEDFELVFTLPPDRLKKVEKFDPIVVGEVIDEGLYLIDEDGKRNNLEGGYDHFE
ncbi:MAG: thiamine-phosphate kinase [Candidatus Thermoplasmatota archaeon]